MKSIINIRPDTFSLVNPWTQIKASIIDEALRHCKGCYQRDIVLGYQALSGSTLKGKAKKWGGKYYRSRLNLIFRLRANGFNVWERTGLHNRRILVIEK
jgi:hypothetical protein